MLAGNGVWGIIAEEIPQVSAHFVAREKKLDELY